VQTGALPPVVIAGTAAMTKLRQKYDKFSFRLGTIDAGVTRIWLYDVATALGLRYADYAETRDAVLAQAIGLRVAGNRNMVTFAVGLGRPGGTNPRPDLTLHRFHYPDALVALTGVLNLPRPEVAPAAPAVLRVPPAQGLSLGANLLARRSLRRFAERPIPPGVLVSLSALADAVNADWERVGALPLKLTLRVAVTLENRDFESGLYRWDTGAGDFKTERYGIKPEDVEPTTLQPSLARAPAVFYVSGNFEDAVRSYGARGYRDLAGRAGAMMGRVQIAAGAYGILGCVWGGIAEEMWGELFRIDRYSDCPLFAGSFGYPTDE
jgi:hypothetical protein